MAADLPVPASACLAPLSVTTRVDIGPHGSWSSGRHGEPRFGARGTGNKIVRILIMMDINVRFVSVRRVSVRAWQKGQ